MRILSIDVGVKNCAFCIEEFDHTKYHYLDDIKKRCDFFGLTKPFKDILKSSYKIGDILYWKVKDFSNKGTIPNDDNRICINLFKYLISIEDRIDEVDIIIIERQMKKNHIARKIEGFLHSHFISKYGIYKTIMDISATKKTQYFHYKEKNKNKRKKFAVKMAKKILKTRNDTINLEKLNKSKKKDDLADSFLQLIVFKLLIFYDKKY